MEPIAVIGIGCRFPGADNPESFWRLLRAGVDAVTEAPAGRGGLADFYDPNPAILGKTNMRWGGFLEEIDKFDPAFFRTSPREAQRMDPQQRILLEVVWEALEDAGQTRERLSGTQAGVFIGMMNTDYAHIQLRKHSLIDSQLGLGSSAGIAANRVSYFLDLQGPSLVVDTLCSSSLVAVHLACQSLWNGESAPLAIAGGVNLILLPVMSIFYTKAGLAAPDGRCKAFDARADGVVRGEGTGVVVLKPLSQAVADGDPVYCLIRGSAVNQEGRSNGLSAPSRWSQMAVLQEAYRRAELSPGLVQYVEAHGTGTALGDPIEAAALGAVLGIDRPAGSRCAVGSVKTNIGHLESAAGIAGLIKTALMIKHRELAPSLHFLEPSPHIPFADLSLRVQQVLEPWTTQTAPLLAGVSSFGLGGTNAHVVLEEPPHISPETQSNDETDIDQTYLLALSAHSRAALESLAGAYKEFLANGIAGQRKSLKDFCYTASVRRSQHDHRLSCIGRSWPEMIECLTAFTRGESLPGLFSGQIILTRRPKLAFVFSGQGAHWWGIGRTLLQEEPTFRQVIEHCDELLSDLGGGSILAELTADESCSHLDDGVIAQPIFFAVQVALAALWRDWGIEPDAVIGHSAGEVAAAHVAGALSLADAVRVIFHRARVIQRVVGLGRMAVAELTLEEARRALAGYENRVTVAAHNSPTSVVISGDSAAVEEVVQAFGQRGVFARLLPAVDYASHGPHMEPLQEELVHSLESIKAGSAAVPIYSTLAGGVLDGQEFGASYWGEQIRRPVLFTDATDALITDGSRTFLELGPHPVLSRAIAQCLNSHDLQGAVLASLRRGQPDRTTMLQSLAALNCVVRTVRWDKVYPAKSRCVRLPPYVWQRERFWLTQQDEGMDLTGNEAAAYHDPYVRGGHPLLGQPFKSAAHPGTYFWEMNLGPDSFPYLKDHRVDGEILMPAAAYTQMALAAAVEAFGPGRHEIEDVVFEKMLVLTAGGKRQVQLVVSSPTPGEALFQIFSNQSEPAERGVEWTLHSQGKIRLVPGAGSVSELGHCSLEPLVTRCREAVSGTEFYRAIERDGFQYGPSFQGIRRLWRRDGEAVAELSLPETLRPEASAYHIHPALLDAGFHLLLAAMPKAPVTEESIYLPVGIRRLRVHQRPGEQVWSHAVVKEAESNSNTVEADVVLFDEDGRVVLEVLGLCARRLAHLSRPLGIEKHDDWLYELVWEPDHDQRSALSKAQPGPRGSWLILADSSGWGQDLKAGLEARGEVCVMAFPGHDYRVVNPGEYQINPNCPQDFRQLLKDAFSPELPPCRGVANLWSLDVAPAGVTTVESLEAAAGLVCGSTLHLVQALAEVGWKTDPRLWLVTCGAQVVEAETKEVAVAQAILWGLGRVVSQEHVQLRCSLIDLPPEAAATARESLLLELWSDNDARQIVWRNDQRYLARLIPCSTRAASAEMPVSLRSDGAYLITGGLGGLGLKVAHWMVQRGVRHLVLISRSEGSEQARAAVAAMRQAGVQVLVAAADVADKDQVAAVLARVDQSMPPLRGVIHAAAVLDDGILLKLNQERFETVLRPKVSGAWNLHQQTLNAPLEFFVLFSSLASLLGSAGQGNYSAANAFLDALAYQRRSQERAALSINWGPWAEVGLAAGLDDRFKRQGLKMITPELGLSLLEQLLAQSRTQVAVMSPTFASRLIAPHQTHNPQNGEGKIGVLVEQITFMERLRKSPPDERRRLLITQIQADAARIMGFKPSQLPDPNVSLLDAGMDSMMAVELGSSLKDRLDQDFPITAMFEYQTIDALSSYLASEVLVFE